MNFPKCEYCGKLAIKGICARCKAKRRLNPNLKKLSREEIKNSTVPIYGTVQKSKTNLTYYERNKERILKRQKEYYHNNKEKIKAYNKAYMQRDPEKWKAYRKEYYKVIK